MLSIGYTPCELSVINCGLLAHDGLKNTHTHLNGCCSISVTQRLDGCENQTSIKQWVLIKLATGQWWTVVASRVKSIIGAINVDGLPVERSWLWFWKYEKLYLEMRNRVMHQIDS